MQCSHPISYIGYEMFIQKWKDDNYWPLIIRHCCFYLVFSIAFASCVAFAIRRNLHLSTTMKLLGLLSILVWLAQPVLNQPFPT